VHQTRHYQRPETTIGLKPNRWDVLALLIILGILAALAWAAGQMQTPYQVGTPIPLSLDPSELPAYASKTILRMFIALLCSFIFTLIVAPIAAKNRQAEKVIIPLIDILQSIPILGMLSITVVAFIELFPNSLMGPECAAIFAIFTSQVWNMTLSFYQSLRTTPKEYYDTAAIFHLSFWQIFWRIELPFAIPGLLWNAMVSMSGGWFFVVAAEAISVSNQSIILPGIGSYIHLAIAKANLPAIFYSILAMLVVIFLYDQLLFRPLLTWAERFKATRIDDGQHPPRAWFYQLLTKTKLLKFIQFIFGNILNFFIDTPKIKLPSLFKIPKLHLRHPAVLTWCWNVVLVFVLTVTILFLWNFITHTVSVSEIKKVFFLGSITALKVAILILLASLIWIPIGTWIGLHAKASHIVQPIIQFLAAFPVNLIYPLMVTLIVRYRLNVEIWSTPLMILGTQWYILFNVIAGVKAIPTELRYVSQNLGLKHWLWWKRLALPAIFPYYVTGSMAAAGGCWNACIVADVLQWGDHRLVATGLGSYIAEHTTTGDFPRIALGIAVMSIYVLVINRLLWRKLYYFSATRFMME